jgi:ribonucleoside-diphosphate reductase alpha chain
VTIGKVGSDLAAMADALGRMISLNLRLNGLLPPRERIRQVVSQLSGIGGARSVGFGPNKVRSLPDAIARVLSQHFGFRVNGKVVDVQKADIGSEQNGKIKSGPAAGNGYANGEIEQKEFAAVSQEHPNQLILTKSHAPSSSLGVKMFDICPECGTASFAYEEGCKKCYSCGYSEC